MRHLGAAERFQTAAQRVVVEVGITRGGRRGLPILGQLLGHTQAATTAGTKARTGVAQIMELRAPQADAPRHGPPGRLRSTQSFQTRGALRLLRLPRGRAGAGPPVASPCHHAPVSITSAAARYRQCSIACLCSDSGGSSSSSVRTPFGSMTLDRIALVPLTVVSLTSAPRALNIAVAAAMFSTCNPK
jgi:hypothetical protein